MGNRYISENIEEAKNYLNDMEKMGMSALHIADRILDSNKLFVHDPDKQKNVKETLDKITNEYNSAKNNAIKKSGDEPDSYEKHVNIANYLLSIHLERTQKLISFWDRLNQKL